jgi:hypothetical protein
MKSIIFCGIGAGMGSATYQVIVHGLSETSWYEAIFIGLISMALFALFKGFKRDASKDVGT